MNQIVNKSLLVGDKFMPEIQLKQSVFTYSACEPFTRNKQRIQKFMQTAYANYIYKNELDKACFQHDMAYGKYKDLEKRTQSDKVLKDKAFEIANNPNNDGYQRGLTSMVYKIFDKKLKGRGIKNIIKQIKNKLMNFINQLLGNLKKEKCILLLKTIFQVLI